MMPAVWFVVVANKRRRFLACVHERSLLLEGTQRRNGAQYTRLFRSQMNSVCEAQQQMHAQSSPAAAIAETAHTVDPAAASIASAQGNSYFVNNKLLSTLSLEQNGAPHR